MISRRLFAGCGLCAAIALTADAVSAQQAAPRFTRAVLHKAPVAGTGYDTLEVAIAVEAHAKVARHTHPGTESGTVLAGEGLLRVEGQPDQSVKPGDTFFVTAGTPHSIDNGAEPMKLISTYVVERDKPLASPA